MGIETGTLLAIMAGASTAAAVYGAEQGRKTASKGRAAAKEAGLKAEADATRAGNKAAAKAPDVNALMAANADAAKGGPGSTMLTGPAGVDPSTLLLGKSTLLGGGG